MTQDEKHAVALMRYGAIAPLISGTKDDFQSLDDYYRERPQSLIRLRTAPQNIFPPLPSKDGTALI